MRTMLLGVFLSLVVVSCKSKVCECADAHVNAVKEINKTSDPIKKMRILGNKKYQKVFKQCNAMTSEMTPEELKDFEAEYEQCPSVKALKSGDLKQ
ncbi:MAG: hypothetical protein K9I25_04625 [Crocinitomicaceae bacterium]|nr:hypothetical protein [Crocinitomicaceae bacterium]